MPGHRARYSSPSMKRSSSPGLLAALAFAGALTASGASLRPAGARTLDDCQLAWSKAVRSYLTKNRKAAPDGSTPTDMEATEAAAQQWLDAFRPACEIEAAGDKPTARIEAAAIGVRVLARLDQRGCGRFLEYYMESTRSEEICRVAVTATDDDLRDRVARTIPQR